MKYLELIELASRFHDEALNARELTRLNELLRDEEARSVFVQISEVHVGLKQELISADDRRLASTMHAVHRQIIPDRFLKLQSEKLSVDTNRPGASCKCEPQLANWKPHPITTGIAAAVVAAVLLLAAFQTPKWVSSGSTDSTEPIDVQQVASDNAPPAEGQDGRSTYQRPVGQQHPEYVARIVAVTTAISWQADGAPDDFLMRMSAGDNLKIASGMVQLEFVDGAQVILNGPAEFEVLGTTSARLVAGSLTGRSEKGNFTLHTPKAEVVDIGTEFGVSVAAAVGTNVAVFEGEVHVKSIDKAGPESSEYRLTEGMALKIGENGVVTHDDPDVAGTSFQRRLPPAAPTNLGVGELSLIDVVCGSRLGEYRIAGAIDPLNGHWGDSPWNQPNGVELRPGEGRFVAVDWNPFVNGLFIPPSVGGLCPVDLAGETISLPSCSGASWGPVWARRRIGADLDPFGHQVGQNDDGFWGAGTVTAMLDRLRWARDGLVGMHANIGLTIDLDAIRRERSASISRLHGIVTLLERSHVSQPFNPKSLADFRVYVDGDERYSRLGFSREDGDAQFGASIDESDRFLTIVVTDSGDGNLFDRVILIDPVLELTKE
jgi:hypothetical protein